MAKENNENESTEEDEQIVRKTISIKGVSADLYKRIQKISNDTGKTIGQVTDEAYRSFMGTVENAKRLSNDFVKGMKEGSSQYIENIKELEITGDDLKEIDRKIIFKDIDTLTFHYMKKYIIILKIKKMNTILQLLTWKVHFSIEKKIYK